MSMAHLTAKGVSDAGQLVLSPCRTWAGLAACVSRRGALPPGRISALLLFQHVQEALQRRELAGRGRVELRGEDRGGGVAGQEREQLVVHRGELGLLDQQLVDRDDADRGVLDLERDHGERLLERRGVLARYRLGEVVLAALGGLADRAVADRDRGASRGL